MSYLQLLVLVLSLRVWKPLTLIDLLAVAEQCCKLPAIPTSLQGPRNSSQSPTMGLADSCEMQLGQEENALNSYFPDRFLQVRAAVLERLLDCKKLSQTEEAIPTVLIN